MQQRHEEQQVDHFLYVGWLDKGACDAETLVKLIQLMRAIDGGKMGCNCSAGVGRTGVVVALNLLIDAYERTKCVPTIFDVFAAVKRARLSRPGSVMNVDQLKLIIQALILYIQTSS